MAIYAAMCRRHMKTYGTTQRQIAAVCSKNHRHSVHNPWSQFRQPYSIDEVFSARPDRPIRSRYRCARRSLTDRAAAISVHRTKASNASAADRRRCIKVAASVSRSATRRASSTSPNATSVASLTASPRPGRTRPDRHGVARGCTTPGHGRDYAGLHRTCASR